MSTKLYVGNLNYDTTEETLSQLFAVAGRTVKEVFMATDRNTGRRRGFAFVEMASAEEAEASIAEFDGKEVDGRTIRVSEARERSETPRFNRSGPRMPFGGGGEERGDNRRGGGGGGGGGRRSFNDRDRSFRR